MNAGGKNRGTYGMFPKSERVCKDTEMISLHFNMLIDEIMKLTTTGT